MDAGILPVKRIDQAKGRLSSHFDDEQRALIAGALVADAIELCAGTEFLRWWVVSDDREVLRSAESRGLGTVDDPGEGLNVAVEAAIAVALKEGADSVTVIPSDVPLAFRGDLVDLLDTGATSDVVLVPSERDGGTNGLFMAPPDLLQPNFGPGSLQKHLQTAERASLRCALLSLPRLSLDLDTVEDIRAYLAKPKHAETNTSRVLQELAALVTE
ncbi:MAG: 2-phospho-L-lactate guanylyltransferase [Actinomycetota bacterium]